MLHTKKGERMKNFVKFFRLHKKGFIATLCAFVIAIATAVSCGVVFSDKPEHPLESSLAAETITPRNSGNWTDAGHYANSFAGGTGTEADPYLISTGAELAKLAVDVNKGTNYSGQYFKLTSNIDLLDYYWTPIGKSTTYYFSGNFDGNGKELQNMIIKYSSSQQFYGLFGFINAASNIVTISNLGLSGRVDVSRTASGTGTSAYIYVGSLVGRANSSSSGEFVINNCYNECSVTGNNTYSVAEVGGLVGFTYTSSSSLIVKNCYNVGSVNATGLNTYVGGLIGTDYSSGSSGTHSITNSYNVGSVKGTGRESARVGGLIGDSQYTYGTFTIGNCYNTGSVTGPSTGSSTYVGGFIGWISSSRNIAISNCYYDSSVFTKRVAFGYGASDATAKAVGGVLSLASRMKSESNYGTTSFGTYTDDNSSTGSAVWGEAWDFVNTWVIDPSYNSGYPTFKSYFEKFFWEYNIASSFAGGIGTETDPYLISNGAELAKLAVDVSGGTNYDGQYFKLTENISLSGKDWTPIGNSSSNYFAGNFDGDSKVISGMTIDGDYQYAGLFGYAYGTTFISNLGVEGCSVTCESTGTRAYVGGLVAYLNGSVSVTNCHVTGSISANASNANIYVGGLFGSTFSGQAITDCLNEASVTGESTAANCFVGGIAGYNSKSKLQDCYNTGKISGDSVDNANIGGLLGSVSSSTVEYCFNEGEVSTLGEATAPYVHIGGLVGQNEYDVKISFSYNSGKVSGQATANSYAGGLIGYAYDGESTINQSYNIGEITATATVGYAGGLYSCVGYGSSTNCFSVAAVTGSTLSGAIVGYAEGFVITNCYYDSGKTSTDLVVASGSATMTASGGVSNLGNNYLRDEKYYAASTAFGTYTADDSTTGSAQWTISWDFTNIWDCEGAFNRRFPTFIKRVKDKLWKFCAAESFAGGTGTSADPYQIATAEQLAKLAVDVNSGKSTYQSKYFKLTANIDLSGKYWTPIGISNNYSFKGKGLQGNNCIISGMTIEGDYDYAGLFGYINTYYGVSFTDLEIKDSSINIQSASSSTIGSIAAYLYNYQTSGNFDITNCISRTEITHIGTSSTAGGVIGTLRYRQNNVNLLGCSNFGGITVKGVSNSIYYTGGIVGQIDRADVYQIYTLRVKDCLNEGNINSTAYRLGGIIGGSSSSHSYHTFEISNCINKATISGDKYAGGIFGVFSASAATLVYDCVNYGNIFGANIGGIVGDIRISYEEGKLYNCINYGILSCNSDYRNTTSTSSSYIGGIAGYSMGKYTVENCKNLCDKILVDIGEINTTTVNVYVGGVAGMLQSNAKTCENIAAIKARIKGSESSKNYLYVGGLVGGANPYASKNYIVDSINKGSISAESSGTTNYLYLGGVSGYLDGASDRTIKLSSNINYGEINGNLKGATNYCYSGGTVGCTWDSWGKSEISVNTNFANIIVKDDGAESSKNYIYVGGTLGYVYTLVETTIEENNNFGNLNVNLTDSTSLGNIIGVGGVVGGVKVNKNYGYFTGCTNFGNISVDAVKPASTSNKIYLGGMFGEVMSTSYTTMIELKNCLSECDISAPFGCMGGLIGYYNSSVGYLIESCYYKGSITSQTTGSTSSTDSIGGLVGYLYTGGSRKIKDCYSKVVINTPNKTSTSYIKDTFGYKEFDLNLFQNYYIDFTLNNTSGTTATKTYVGATDGTGESFGSEFWFFNDNFKNGELTLKGIYHIGKGITTTSEENIAKLEALGYTAA